MAIPVTAMRFEVTLEQVVLKHLDTDVMRGNLKEIGSAATRNKQFNLNVSIPRNKINIHPFEDETGETKYRYTALLVVWKDGFRSPGAVLEQFNTVKPLMMKVANRLKWTLVEGNATPETEAIIASTSEKKPKEPKRIVSNNTNIVVPDLTSEVFESHFDRLYNREPHIRLIYDSVKAAINTGFKNRNHVLLYGLAATAKTELFNAFRNFIGVNNVWHVDATTTTKAGLERELVKRSQEKTLPPFILIEEIEKVTNPDNINCLLQVMDTRGMIQRTNARVGDVYEECKVVVWATCNDSNLLRGFADGAIWSRFNMRLICKRPDETLMRRILTRCVIESKGDVRWVEPVIRFMWDQLKLLKEYKYDYNDPRLGRALLAGEDRLFDTGPQGFFADYLSCCEGKETGEEKGDNDVV